MELSPRTRVPLFPLLDALSEAIDLVWHPLVDHHRRVAYISASIGQMLELEKEDFEQLVIAAAGFPTEARILAVADTFTALTEDRPYRCGIDPSNTDQIMREMAVYQKLDKDLVDLTHENIQEIASLRKEAQRKADNAHKQFLKECQMPGTDFDEDERCRN